MTKPVSSSCSTPFIPAPASSSEPLPEPNPDEVLFKDMISDFYVQPVEKKKLTALIPLEEAVIDHVSIVLTNLFKQYLETQPKEVTSNMSVDILQTSIYSSWDDLMRNGKPEGMRSILSAGMRNALLVEQSHLIPYLLAVKNLTCLSPGDLSKPAAELCSQAIPITANDRFRLFLKSFYILGRKIFTLGGMNPAVDPYFSSLQSALKEINTHTVFPEKERNQIKIKRSALSKRTIIDLQSIIEIKAQKLNELIDESLAFIGNGLIQNLMNNYLPIFKSEKLTELAAGQIDVDIFYADGNIRAFPETHVDKKEIAQYLDEFESLTWYVTESRDWLEEKYNKIIEISAYTKDYWLFFFASDKLGSLEEKLSEVRKTRVYLSKQTIEEILTTEVNAFHADPSSIRRIGLAKRVYPGLNGVINAYSTLQAVFSKQLGFLSTLAHDDTLKTAKRFRDEFLATCAPQPPSSSSTIQVSPPTSLKAFSSALRKHFAKIECSAFGASDAVCNAQMHVQATLDLLKVGTEPKTKQQLLHCVLRLTHHSYLATEQMLAAYQRNWTNASNQEDLKKLITHDLRTISTFCLFPTKIIRGSELRWLREVNKTEIHMRSLTKTKNASFIQLFLHDVAIWYNSDEGFDKVLNGLEKLLRKNMNICIKMGSILKGQTLAESLPKKLMNQSRTVFSHVQKHLQACPPEPSQFPPLICLRQRLSEWQAPSDMTQGEINNILDHFLVQIEAEMQKQNELQPSEIPNHCYHVFLINQMICESFLHALIHAKEKRFSQKNHDLYELYQKLKVKISFTADEMEFLRRGKHCRLRLRYPASYAALHCDDGKKDGLDEILKRATDPEAMEEMKSAVIRDITALQTIIEKLMDC